MGKPRVARTRRSPDALWGPSSRLAPRKWMEPPPCPGYDKRTVSCLGAPETLGMLFVTPEWAGAQGLDCIRVAGYWERLRGKSACHLIFMV